MYSYGPPHMAVQKQDDQHEHTFSNYVRIQDVVLKTCLRRWTIGKSSERGSGISVLPARHDDDDFLFYCFLLVSTLSHCQKIRFCEEKVFIKLFLKKSWYVTRETTENELVTTSHIHSLNKNYFWYPSVFNWPLYDPCYRRYQAPSSLLEIIRFVDTISAQDRVRETKSRELFQPYLTLFHIWNIVTIKYASIFKSCRQHQFPWPCLSVCLCLSHTLFIYLSHRPYHPSPSASPPDFI